MLKNNLTIKNKLYIVIILMDYPSWTNFLAQKFLTHEVMTQVTPPRYWLINSSLPHLASPSLTLRYLAYNRIDTQYFILRTPYSYKNHLYIHITIKKDLPTTFRCKMAIRWASTGSFCSDCLHPDVYLAPNKIVLVLLKRVGVLEAQFKPYKKMRLCNESCA